MKVITIKQPFASLIVLGIKKYECRTWKTKYRGDILIHAGKGVNKKAMEKFAYLNLSYPSGCILAKATLTDCIEMDSTMREKLQEENKIVYSRVISDTSWKGYAFKLENVEKVVPVSIKGHLSLWDYDENIERL